MAGIGIGGGLGSARPARVLRPPEWMISEKLRWKRSDLTIVDPVSFNVGTGFWSNDGNSGRPGPAALLGRDVTLVFPGTARTGDLQLDGARSATIVGGNSGNGRVTIRNLTHFGWVEGVSWAMTSTAKDCLNFFAAAGASPDWYFQNLIMRGIRGQSSSVPHPDGPQPVGRVGGWMRFHRCTADTNYQWGFLSEQTPVAPIAGVDMSMVNGSFNAFAPSDPTTHPLWFRDTDQTGGTGTRHYPVKLHQVYWVPRAGQSIATGVVQPAAGATIGGVDVSPVILPDGRVRFPAVTNIKGEIIPGVPPGGDFCKIAGAAYATPG